MENTAAPPSLRLIRASEIVAFLQNPWFKPGTDEGHIRLYMDDVDFRRRVLSMSMTGTRLLNAFGSDFYEGIWWDNANPRPTFDPQGALPPDKEHIYQVIERHRPVQLILTFGLHARSGVQEVLESRMGRPEALAWMETHVMHCHHPNARYKNQVDLENFALAVKRKAVQDV